MFGPVGYAFLSALAVSVFSFVGLLALTLGGKRLDNALFVLIGLAVGTLFGDVLIHLIPEIFSEINGDSVAPAILIMVGVLIFFVMEKFFHWHHSHTCEGDECDLPRPLGYINIVSDGFHNLLDGILIGASYLVSVPIGLATTVAVIFHEIPQEISDFGVLLHAGFSKARALFWNFISALFAVTGVAIAVIVGSRSAEFIQVILPLTAGGFLYLAGSDLVPELHKEKSIRRSALQFIAILVGFIIMLAIPG
jgi:zinc and cadmium transporter